jgi:hypothetical protein
MVHANVGIDDVVDGDVRHSPKTPATTSPVSVVGDAVAASTAAVTTRRVRIMLERIRMRVGGA